MQLRKVGIMKRAKTLVEDLAAMLKKDEIGPICAGVGVLAGIATGFLFHGSFGVGLGIGFCVVMGLLTGILFDAPSGAGNAIAAAIGYFVPFGVLKVIGTTADIGSHLNVIVGIVIGIVASCLVAYGALEGTHKYLNNRDQKAKKAAAEACQ